MPNLEGLYYRGTEEAMEVLEPWIDKTGGVSQDATEKDWLGQLDHFGRSRYGSDAPLQQG